MKNRDSFLLALSTAVAVTAAPLCFVASAQQTKDVIQEQLNDAAAALQKGMISQAIQFYTQALADRGLSNDRRATALTDRGAAHMRRQDYKSAIEDFNRAVQLSPEYAPAYNNRGNALIAVGAPREALKDFDRAIVLAPTFGAAYANRASAHFRAGAFDQALSDYTRAIELTPHSVSAYNGRGLVHLAADRPHSAARDFTRALGLDVRFAAGYRNRASAHTVLAKSEDAVEDLSRAITFDPNNSKSLLLRGEAYLQLGNPASAVKDFNRALELTPKSAPAFAGRALAHAKAEAMDEALNDLAKALELDPKLARAYAIRSWVYRQLNQLDLAQKDAERASKIEPITADALWAQGELEDALGRSETSIQAFTKALSIDHRHRLTHESLTRLGLVATRDEVEISGGIEGWRLLQAGSQFVARHPQYPNLAVPLEMLAKGKPRITRFERQKAPYTQLAVLYFHAGQREAGASNVEELEMAAVLDLQNQTTIGMALNKRGAKLATWAWEDRRIVIESADGASEEIPLKGAAIVSAMDRARQGGAALGAGSASASKSGGTPAWAPWAKNEYPGAGAPPGSGSKQAARQQKPKTLFEMLFGN